LFYSPTSTTYTSPLSLHDALPISFRPFLPRFQQVRRRQSAPVFLVGIRGRLALDRGDRFLNFLDRLVPPEIDDPRVGPGLLHQRSEEHTSELQSRRDLVCRLLLEK